MDTFDIRKFITENRINEAPLKDKVDSLLAYYEAETGEPADSGMEREIKIHLAKGKHPDDVKSIIVNKDNINEEKDVIEPDEDVIDAENADKDVETERGPIDEKEKEEVEEYMKRILLYAHGRGEEFENEQVHFNRVINPKIYVKAIKTIRKSDWYDDALRDEWIDTIDRVKTSLELYILEQHILSKGITDVEKAKEAYNDMGYTLDLPNTSPSDSGFEKLIQNLKDGDITDINTWD